MTTYINGWSRTIYPRKRQNGENERRLNMSPSTIPYSSSKRPYIILTFRIRGFQTGALVLLKPCKSYTLKQLKNLINNKVMLLVSIVVSMMINWCTLLHKLPIKCEIWCHEIRKIWFTLGREIFFKMALRNWCKALIDSGSRFIEISSDIPVSIAYGTPGCLSILALTEPYVA